VLLVHVCFLASVNSLYAESHISVNSYKKADYGGGNQNWDISINEKGVVFVANNAGLLVIDGSGTHLYKIPGNLIIRSVAAIGDKVYTGSFEEFGYWQLNESTAWEYHSLVSLLKNFDFHNEEIWSIVQHNNKIYFQSFGAIFCYDKQTIEPLQIPGSVLFLLQCGEHLYTQHVQGKLYEIIDKQLVGISGSEIFSQTEIKTILPLDHKNILIGTSSKGLFTYDGSNFEPWQTDINASLIESTVNKGLRIGNNLVFGTILNGVFIMDMTGKAIDHFHSGNSLQNNTILALIGDTEGNLWVGMDKGIDYLSFNTPIDVYHETELNIGMVYTAALYNNELYVGTNQGVYYYSFNGNGLVDDCRFLPNSQGQVWFLKKISGKLYCGMNGGTYVIENHNLIRVCDVSGGYNLVNALAGSKELYLQSTYYSIVVFEKNENIWEKSHLLDGFVAPVRYLEMDHLGNILLGHSITGLYLLQPDASYRSSAMVKKIGEPEGLFFPANRVCKVDNRIVISGSDSLYQWDAIHGKIVPFTELNTQLGDFKASKNIIPVSDDQYWMVNGNEAGLFEIRFGKARLIYRIIPEAFGFELVENNENIVALNDSLHLICIENGFAVLNIHKMNQLSELTRPPVIKKIVVSNGANENKTYTKPWESQKSMKNVFNNIQITFASEEPIGKKNYFRYQLQGFESDWNEWETTSTVTYNRLPPGEYKFRVKTLTNKGIETATTELSFAILQPWYLTYFAFFVYFILTITFVLLIRTNYKRRRWRHQEQALKLENEKMRTLKEKAEAEMIKVANERLQSVVSLKNMELAKNTMSIIRKNEALIEVKDEVEKQKEELGYRLPNKYFDNIVRLIDKNITSDHDWEIFESHFDQAHENFFKKLKAQYPDLTPHDFRLCAYLKLNLSSKEIAPLLNITIRGVEEKRYRLRKRLNLASDQGLTEFIMKF
jgi:DNA-binding CsgD family transcriptional regulator